MNTETSPAAPAKEILSPARSLRILVVENHPDTLLSLCLYLEDLGHFTTTARTVAEGLVKLQDASLQVLLSDIGLPDGTGWDLLDRAHLSPDMFAIAMSGFGMNADSERSLQAGFQRHLLKPFRSGELEKALDDAAAVVP